MLNAPASVGFVPTRLVIASIRVDAVVNAKPTEMQWDEFLHKNVASFGIPDDLSSTVWWSDGAKPGENGLAVIVGHTKHSGGAVFDRLSSLAVGADVVVSRAGSHLGYRIVKVVRGLRKTDPNALRSALENAPANARLALVTCTGAYDGHTTVENTVVFAAPTT